MGQGARRAQGGVRVPDIEGESERGGGKGEESMTSREDTTSREGDEEEKEGKTYLVKLLSSSSKNSFATPSGPSSQVFSLTIIKDASSLRAAFDRRRKSTNSEWDVWPDISSLFVNYNG
jgi:hypothetical protein